MYQRKPYVVERRLPGYDARSVISSNSSRNRMLEAAITAIGELHRGTVSKVVVDSEMLRSWVTEPLIVLRKLMTPRWNKAKNHLALNKLENELCGALSERLLPVCWIHGDFTPSNILVSRNGQRVTGIVDWELAASNEWPQLDVIWLLITTRMIVRKRELGDIVREILEGSLWDSLEDSLLNAARLNVPGDNVDLRTSVLLCWLKHITCNLNKSSRYARHRLWIAKNIEGVLWSI
jgi:hypothetical protein